MRIFGLAMFVAALAMHFSLCRWQLHGAILQLFNPVEGMQVPNVLFWGVIVPLLLGGGGLGLAFRKQT